ncbi:MAG: hypothetical protein ABIQ73_24650 [Acidimicrobiales bacterium]
MSSATLGDAPPCVSDAVPAAILSFTSAEAVILRVPLRTRTALPSVIAFAAASAGWIFNTVGSRC